MIRPPVRAEVRRVLAGFCSDQIPAAASLSPGILEFERIQELERLAHSSKAKTPVLGGNGANPSVLLST